jgi:hypothetical protein
MELDFIQKSKEIIFEPINHTYHTKNGKELISVSKFIHHFGNPFDPDGSILIKCAKKEGISPEKLQEKWTKMKDDACIKGHLLHECAEHYVKHGRLKRGHKDNDIIREFRKIKFEGKLYSEVILFDEDLGICGTTDLISVVDEPKRIIDLRDFKTNKAIKKFSFGKYLKYPFNSLPDANFYHYTIQLGVYSFLLEKLGWWVRSREILWVNPKTRKIEIFPVQYERSLIKKALTYYKNPDSMPKYNQSTDDDLEEFLS